MATPEQLAAMAGAGKIAVRQAHAAEMEAQKLATLFRSNGMGTTDPEAQVEEPAPWYRSGIPGTAIDQCASTAMKQVDLRNARSRHGQAPELLWLIAPLVLLWVTRLWKTLWPEISTLVVF